MNKAILTVCLLALLLTAANTFMLVQMGGKMKETGDKIEPVAKAIEKVESTLKSFDKGNKNGEKGGPPIKLPGLP